MNGSNKKWNNKFTLGIHRWWVRYKTTLLSIAIGGMAVMALLAFKAGFWRLLFDPGPSGAIDLRITYDSVQHWFSGAPTYTQLKTAVYPPATYLLLWPFMGWLEITSARWLWGITTGGALLWLIKLILRESKAETLFEYIFIALLLLSMYATGITIGNGQRIIHLLPMLLMGILLLSSENPKWYQDFLSAGMILFSLIFPNISAPFFWIVLFLPKRIRPALFIILGYAALTLFALSFQKIPMIQVIQGFFERGLKGVVHGSASGGYGNLQTLLVHLGMKRWIIPVSLTTIGILGFWVYRYRDRDRWILLGVTALFARLWAYHRLYDDLLLLLPMIALFRITKQASTSQTEKVGAGLLLGITLPLMCGSARPISTPFPFNVIYQSFLVLIWMIILIFLTHYLRKVRKKKDLTQSWSSNVPEWKQQDDHPKSLFGSPPL